MSKKSKKKSGRVNNAAKSTSVSQKKPWTKEKKITVSVCIALAVAILGTVVGIIIYNAIISREEMGTGASPYLETRDVTDNDITYVEMSVKDYGKMVILLDATTAPKTVANFISLVEDGFYNGTTFYSAIDDFAIKGGDPDGTGDGGSDDRVDGEFFENFYLNEERIPFDYGVIGMARDEDFDSATSRFFICNSKDKSRYDFEYEPAYGGPTPIEGYYAAFGYVVQGMSVVDAITNDYKDNNGIISDKSEQPVIEYIKVLDSWEKP